MYTYVYIHRINVHMSHIHKITENDHRAMQEEDFATVRGMLVVSQHCNKHQTVVQWRNCYFTSGVTIKAEVA